MDAAEKAMMAEVEAKEAETMLKDIEIFGLDPRNPNVIHLVSIGRAERRRAQKFADLPLPTTTEERAHRQFLQRSGRVCPPKQCPECLFASFSLYSGITVRIVSQHQQASR